MKLKKNHPDESEMFRAAMTDVRRLKPGNRTEHRPSRPGALPLQRQRDEKSVMEELLAAGADPADMETGEELLYLRPGHSARLLRRLRRGHFSVADSIDLHHGLFVLLTLQRQRAWSGGAVFRPVARLQAADVGHGGAEHF